MLEEFRAILGKRGFSKPSLFIVNLVNTPPALNEIRGVSDLIRDLPLHAESAEFPGTQILTQESRFYDLPQKFAYAKAHDDLNLTFRMDADFQIRRLFELWINSVYNPATGDLRYKNEYSGTIHIHQMRHDGTIAYSVELQECFPTQLGQISLGWDQDGNYTRQPVTFTFRRMKPLATENRAPLTEPKNTSTSRNSQSEMVQQYKTRDENHLKNILTGN